jgi:hypothetical protein
MNEQETPTQNPPINEADSVLPPVDIDPPAIPQEVALVVPPPSAVQPPSMPEDDGYSNRLERLGGEPAPVITPEEFARLQKMGQVNIDARGRVQTTRRSDAEAGVSLRKRRAWYGT